MYKILIISILFFANSFAAFSQAFVPPMKDVRIGKLDNGFTYYILPNSNPKGKIFFNLVQKVGSICETKSQSGYAHFLEHMAFNGTRHFPGRKGMLKALKQYGIEFGKHLNAYTDHMETVYRIEDIDSGNEELIDKCLTVMYDWCNGIEIVDEEVDKERGIILEEWSKVYQPVKKIDYQCDTLLMNGFSNLGKQTIGDSSVIKSLNASDLTSFYKKWYTANRQCVVIVGDIDAEKMEQRVKKLFSDLPLANNEEKIVLTEIKPHDNFRSLKIKEESLNKCVISYNKTFKTPEYSNTKQYFKDDILAMIFSSLVKQRLYAIKIQEKEMSNLSMNANAVQLWEGYKRFEIGIQASSNKDLLKNWKQACIVWEDIKRNGFTDKELAPLVNKSIENCKKILANYAVKKSSDYLKKFKNEYINGRPNTCDKAYVEKMLEVLKNIKAEDLKTVVEKVEGYRNPSMIVHGFDDKDFPSVVTLKEIMDKVSNSKETWHFEEIKADLNSILTNDIQRGKIVKQKSAGILNAKKYTLSNGIKVLYHKSKEYGNSMALLAVSKGARYHRFDASRFIVNATGNVARYNEYKRSEVERALFGRIENIKFRANVNGETINAHSSREEFDFLMHYLVSRYSNINVDKVHRGDICMENNRLITLEQCYNIGVSREYKLNSYMHIFDQGVTVPSTNVSPEYTPERMVSDFKKTFDPKHFVWVFTGNMEEQRFKEVISRYLAGFKVGKDKKKVVKALKLPYREGRLSKKISLNIKKGIGLVTVRYTNNIKVKEKDKRIIDIAQRLIKERLFQRIREELQAVYNIGNFWKYEKGRCICDVNFNCEKRRAKELIKEVMAIMSDIQQNGFKEKDIEVMISTVMKERENRDISNISRLVEYVKTGEDIRSEKYYNDIYKKLTAEEVNNRIKDILDTENIVDVIFYNKGRPNLF